MVVAFVNVLLGNVWVHVVQKAQKRCLNHTSSKLMSLLPPRRLHHCSMLWDLGDHCQGLTAFIQ